MGQRGLGGRSLAGALRSTGGGSISQVGTELSHGPGAVATPNSLAGTASNLATAQTPLDIAYASNPLHRARGMETKSLEELQAYARDRKDDLPGPVLQQPTGGYPGFAFRIPNR